MMTLTEGMQTRLVAIYDRTAFMAYQFDSKFLILHSKSTLNYSPDCGPHHQSCAVRSSTRQRPCRRFKSSSPSPQTKTSGSLALPRSGIDCTGKLHLRHPSSLR